MGEASTYESFFFLMQSKCSVLINSLPYNKLLDWLKLKAFAEDEINVAEKLKFVLERVENIWEKK